MAQYTPKAWKAASPKAQLTFRRLYRDILKIVQQKARKYFNLASINNDDLVQEGLIAALYAVDSYVETRGKLEAYIGTNVNNAMMMIVAESRAQCRQPYTWIQADDNDPAPPQVSAQGSKPAPEPKHKGWRRVPAMPDHDLCEKVEDVERLLPTELREAELERLDRLTASRARLALVRATLAPVARRVFDVQCEPPPEIFIIARNQAGRNISGKGRLPNKAIAVYLGVKDIEVERATRAIREAVTARYPERLRREVMR